MRRRWDLRTTSVSAAVLTVLVIAAVSGCSHFGQSSSNRTENESPSEQPELFQDVVTVEPGAIAKAEEKDLRDVCRCVTGFVDRQIRQHNQRLISLGFQPDLVRLEVRPTAGVAKCEQKALLARRVCQVLADELSRLENVSVRLEEDHADPLTVTSSVPSLTVNITNDFEAGGFFDDVRVHFTLAIEAGRSSEHRASFASEGLCCVVLSTKEPRQVLVTAEKNGQVVSFEGEAGKWFLVPVGSRVTIRWRGRALPPLVAGLQNVWNLNELAVAASHDAPSLAASPGVLSLVKPPPVRKPIQEEKSPPRVEIVLPVDRAAVPHRCAVSGHAIGLEGASVQVFIHPLGDVEYPQSLGSVRNGTWRCSDCVFGRVGQDSGQQFLVKARAGSANGLIESPSITVTRQ